MNRNELHIWECAIERICGDNANEMFEIAQDIYNTAYVRGKNAKEWEIAEQEQKQGHWFYNNGSYMCEFCGHEITGREEDLNYCCKCGAKMKHGA